MKSFDCRKESEEVLCCPDFTDKILWYICFWRHLLHEFYLFETNIYTAQADRNDFDFDCLFFECD